MSNTQIEVKTSPFFQFEFKSLDEDGTFEGYAATWTKDLGGDVIDYGAFTGTLKEHKGRVPFLFNHSWMRPIGYGLEAKEDEHGLWVRGEYTLGSTDGRDAYEIAKHAQKSKQPHGLSIGYSINGENGAEMRGTTRRLKSLSLHEYSMAVFPMNPKARMREVKSGANVRELEDYLRSFGVLSLDAKRFISAVKATRDVEPAPDDSQTRDVNEKASALFNELELFTLMSRLQEFTHHG